MSLLNQINEQYLTLHTAKEDAFWGAKMGLKDYKAGSFEESETKLKAFTSDAGRIPIIQKEIQRTDLTAEDKIGLEGWLRFFKVNAIESEDAKVSLEKLIESEGAMELTKRSMKLGYVDAKTKEFKPAGTEDLRLNVANAADEGQRKSAWQSLQSIETHVLGHGFLDIVKERNRFAKLQGYSDYYEYKVQLFEGFSKEKLFSLLDELEVTTRDVCRKSVESVVAERGESAREGWNFEHYISGSLSKQMDPYFSFEQAFEKWAQSFSALGIRYKNANLHLDLIGRKNKEENGFMHGPGPCYLQGNEFTPARINFTSFALPDKQGSGHRALNTLFHEGGHAAHFSNILMPAPCFSQEFAPTSVAFAETQSMFLDNLVDDPDWLQRYAKKTDGTPIPESLILAMQGQEHKFRAYRLRSMLAVPYAERAIYEMKEAELTPDNVLKMLRATERRLLFLNASVRPILSVPHLLSGEASAYYHGYVLAQMAVFQTREYFTKKYGYLMDNPNVGKELANHYWAPGNSKTFLQLLHDLTGEPFSAKATAAVVNQTKEQMLDQARAKMSREKTVPHWNKAWELDARISLVHGDEVIASNLGGEKLEEMNALFATWVRKHFPKNA